MDVLANPLVESLTTRCRKLNAFAFHYFDSTFLFLMRVLDRPLSQLDSIFDVRKFAEQQQMLIDGNKAVLLPVLLAAVLSKPLFGSVK